MKKLISLLLVLALLLCCAACADQEKDEPETTTTASEPSEGTQSSEDAQPAVDGDATVLTVGDHDISVRQMNYFFMDSVSQWYNNYGAYAAYFGLDFQKSLDEQVYDQTTGQTWGDYFLAEAVEVVKLTYAMYDAAQEAGYTMPEAELTQLQAMFDSMEEQAQYYGYENADEMLKTIYGEVSSSESYQEFGMMYSLANSYASHYAETLRDSYTDEMLRAFEGGTPYVYNNYTYATVYLDLDAFLIGGTEDSDGEMVYTDEEVAAAKKLLASAAGQLSAPDINTVEKLNEAIKAMEQELAQAKGEQIEDEKYSTATENVDMAYSKISSLMQEWIRDEARVSGHITAMPYESTGTGEDGTEVKTLEGYYIILFQERNENLFPLANVRHILVAFEGGTTDSTTGQTIYSEEEKEAAKKAAEELLAQWLEGDATEESFAQLANECSDDGDGTTGGLYEDVYPGQMVTNFNDWCFDESRQTGDHGIVESPYGYHVMFYAGDSQQSYRNYMVSGDKLDVDMEQWQKDLMDAVTVEEIALDLVDTGRIIA